VGEGATSRPSGEGRGREGDGKASPSEAGGGRRKETPLPRGGRGGGGRCRRAAPAAGAGPAPGSCAAKTRAGARKEERLVLGELVEEPERGWSRSFQLLLGFTSLLRVAEEQVMTGGLLGDVSICRPWHTSLFVHRECKQGVR